MSTLANGGKIWTPNKPAYLAKLRAYIIFGYICFWVGGAVTAIASALSLSAVLSESLSEGIFPIALGMFIGGFSMIVLNSSLHKKNIMTIIAFYTLSVIIVSLGIFRLPTIVLEIMIAETSFTLDN